jgi:ribosomal protein S18 acetylase RimI-like enzyme
MKRSDVPDVVKIHLLSFEGFFLSFLGDRFLRLYYESICDFRQLRLVARRDSEIVGFVVGIENSFGFYQSLLKYRIHRFAMAVVPALLKTPSIAPRLLRALFKRSERGEERENSATLTSIAVRPDIQSRGLGHELLRSFVEEAVNRRISKILLETDAVGNEAVCSFYEREGFAVCREYTTPENRRMREYLLEIPRLREQ